MQQNKLHDKAIVGEYFCTKLAIPTHKKTKIMLKKLRIVSLTLVLLVASTVTLQTYGMIRELYQVTAPRPGNARLALSAASMFGSMALASWYAASILMGLPGECKSVLETCEWHEINMPKRIACTILPGMLSFALLEPALTIPLSLTILTRYARSPYALEGPVAWLTRLKLKYGADPHHEYADGSTPLHWAQNSAVVRTLLDSGANLHAEDAHGLTPLRCAIEHNNTQVSATLIAAGANLNVTIKEGDPLRKGNTLLHLAADRGYTKIVRLLLANGANAEALNELQLTPLHFARNVAIADILLDAGANLHATDTNDMTPLHHAALYNNDQLTTKLLAAGANIEASPKTATPLIYAVVPDNAKTATVLIKAGANPLARNRTGQTTLHFAVCFCHSETINLLLANGADVEARDHKKNTPLHLAAAKGKIEAAQILIRMGANLNARDNLEYSPLQCAAHNRKHEMVKLLVEQYKVDPNNGPIRPLYCAACKGDTKTTRMLLEMGVDMVGPDELYPYIMHQESRDTSPQEAHSFPHDTDHSFAYQGRLASRILNFCNKYVRILD